MKGLDKYNLERHCRKHGVDVHEIDYTLTHAEDLKQLRLILPKTVKDFIGYPDFIFEETLRKLVKDCKKLIWREKRSIKKAKYEIGKRILEDAEYLTREYGDDYFSKLANRINEKGYGRDQLYKCVKFAKHPSALEWLEDDTVTWEKIRIEQLCEKLLAPIKSAGS